VDIHRPADTPPAIHYLATPMRPHTGTKAALAITFYLADAMVLHSFLLINGPISRPYLLKSFTSFTFEPDFSKQGNIPAHALRCNTHPQNYRPLPSP
jgi:hypothetical protein